MVLCPPRREAFRRMLLDFQSEMASRTVIDPAA
jgi:hypothetical protein